MAAKCACGNIACFWRSCLSIPFVFLEKLSLYSSSIDRSIYLYFVVLSLSLYLFLSWWQISICCGRSGCSKIEAPELNQHWRSRCRAGSQLVHVNLPRFQSNALEEVICRISYVLQWLLTSHLSSWDWCSQSLCSWWFGLASLENRVGPPPTQRVRTPQLDRNKLSKFQNFQESSKVNAFSPK